jgi:hypothetical protein
LKNSGDSIMDRITTSQVDSGSAGSMTNHRAGRANDISTTTNRKKNVSTPNAARHTGVKVTVRRPGRIVRSNWPVHHVIGFLLLLLVTGARAGGRGRRGGGGGRLQGPATVVALELVDTRGSDFNNIIASLVPTSTNQVNVRTVNIEPNAGRGVSIIAIVADTAAVTFAYNGVAFGTRTTRPFAMCGTENDDNTLGPIPCQNLLLGTHQVTVTPFGVDGVSGTAWTVQFTLFEGEDTPAPLAPATAAPVMAVAPVTAAPVLAVAPNVTAAPVVSGVPLVPAAPMVPPVNVTPVAAAPMAAAPMVPPIFLTAPVAAAPVVAFVPVLLPTAPSTFAPIFNLTAVRVAMFCIAISSCPRPSSPQTIYMHFYTAAQHVYRFLRPLSLSLSLYLCPQTGAPCLDAGGILAADSNTCCPAECGRCGGVGCQDRPGGAELCCLDAIRRDFSNKTCGASVDPPCVLAELDRFCKEGILTSSGACCPASCGACGGSNCNLLPGGIEMCCAAALFVAGLSCNNYPPPCVVSDPNCTKGLMSSEGGACCPASCGACGGANCNALPGGAALCCSKQIIATQRSCSEHAPPCVVENPVSSGIRSMTMSMTKMTALLLLAVVLVAGLSF